MAATTIPAASPCGWPARGSSPASPTATTDDFSYNIVENPVHIRDMNATILHQFGIDASQFNYSYQGLEQRLIGVVEANSVKGILA